jgi:hypothetical protein
MQLQQQHLLLLSQVLLQQHLTLHLLLLPLQHLQVHPHLLLQLMQPVLLLQHHLL